MSNINLKYIDLTVSTANSDGKPVPGTERRKIILFNSTQITHNEVETLINTGELDFDDRVVILRPNQLQYLKDKSN